MSRVHLIQGIMSYLASPLWLMLLVAGLGLAIVARYTEPNYFPDGFSLFPAWPVFDPELALALLDDHGRRALPAEGSGPCAGAARS